MIPERLFVYVQPGYNMFSAIYKWGVVVLINYSTHKILPNVFKKSF